MKRLSLALMAGLTFFAFAKTPTHSTYSPSNLIIATDLDDVLLKRSKGTIAKTIFKQLPRCNRLYKIYKQRKSRSGSIGEKFGEGFYLYLEQEQKPKYAKLIKKICTAKRFKKNTLALMQRLSNQGYEIYTATNIGSIFFKDLQQKYPNTFNDQFIKHGMTVDFTQNEVIQKPDPRYFEKLKTKLNPEGDKTILFIDDKLENVHAARNSGLKAIHFVNAQQLKQALHNYGICTCK